jgi:glutamate 5-kinase
MAELRLGGRDVILTSSGAIAAGVEAMGLKIRPTSLPDLQVAAAVGQVRLMTLYDRFFASEKCIIGQVLLTHADLKNRTRHLNARNTMLTLLGQGIIPIVNENDVVSVDEIKFGDNDLLASLVTILTEADALLLLTTADGLQKSIGSSESRIPYLPSVTNEALSLASGKGSDFSLGGMASKLQSAQTAVDVGVRVVIADGTQEQIIPRIMRGEDVGTLIGGGERYTLSKMNRRKQWIAFFHKTSGAVVIDKGAQAALEQHNYSLLPIGIRDVQGNFPRGALVNIKSLDGEVIGRGLADFSSDEILRIKGRKTNEIELILGSNDFNEVIHRENMVVLTNKNGESKNGPS